MLRGLALGATLVYGAYLTHNAVLVARLLISGVVGFRRAGKMIEEMVRESESLRKR